MLMTTAPFEKALAMSSRVTEDGEPIMGVAELNRAVRGSLEQTWGQVWIEGELSDVTRAMSGHCYFTLNDPHQPAQLRAVMFRGDASRVGQVLSEGKHVQVRGKLSLYEPRGSFQLIVRHMRPAGEGELAAKFEALRKQLEEEGLCDPERKRPLPRFPRCVGVVTSRAGAAMHDILRVAEARCPLRLVVADCRVQGESAPASIVRALQALRQEPAVDVVIVSRGGGSTEDLWAFNDVAVARAIAAHPVPVVSGVGHEVDVTIADLVADVRAATPSNAAEIVVPEKQVLQAELESWNRRLVQAVTTQIGRERLQLERYTRRCRMPASVIAQPRKLLAQHERQVAQRGRQLVDQAKRRLDELQRTLMRHDPRAQLARDRDALHQQHTKLVQCKQALLQSQRQQLNRHRDAIRSAAQHQLSREQQHFAELAGRLDAMSPMKVLARGYAIALHKDTGKALIDASDAQVGDELTLRLSQGAWQARLTQRLKT